MQPTRDSSATRLIISLDLHDSAVGEVLPALDQIGGDARHCWGKSRGHGPPEQRRQGPPQPLPLLAALHADQAVGHSRRQDPPLDSALAVGQMILDENFTDGRRIAHHRVAHERKSAEHDRLFEVRFGPAFERVGSQGLQ